jgi:hypothetical protein
MKNEAKNSQTKHLEALEELQNEAKAAGFLDLASAVDRALQAGHEAMDAYASGDVPKQRAAVADMLRIHADAMVADANRGPLPKELEKAGRKALKAFGKAIDDSAD